MVEQSNRELDEIFDRMEKSLKRIRSTLEEIESEEGAIETQVKMMEIIKDEEEKLNDIQSINNLSSAPIEVETYNVIEYQKQQRNEPKEHFYQVFEKKEVEVSIDKDTTDSDTNSTEVSITTITCIQQPKHNNFPKRGPGTFLDQESKAVIIKCSFEDKASLKRGAMLCK